MAGAHYAISTIFFFSPIKTQKTIKLSPISKFKILKRKNYLRPKILKTLNPKPPISISPVLPQQPQTNPEIPIESQQIEIPIELISENSENLETSENLEKNSGIIISNNNKLDKLSGKSVLKLGFCLVGIFVIQTIIAVWIGLRNDKEEENLKEEDNNKLKHGKLISQNIYVNESELEKKIVEIRGMAKEARESEQKGAAKSDDLGTSDIGDDEEVNGSGVSRVRNGIEKEVSTRLVNVKKKLNNVKEKSSQGSSVSYLSKGEKEEEGGSKENDLGGIEFNGSLMFKKKTKFRSSNLDKPKNSPQGFSGLGYNGSVLKNKNSLSSVDSTVGSGSGFGNGKGPSLVDREWQFDVQIPKESYGTSTKSDEHVSQRRNSNFKGKIENKPVAGKLSNQQSDNKNELWWLKLPYVFGILMRRGSNPEDAGGLYTLKNTSQAKEQAYTVAFENNSDANNFCYLLESFFEDLGDFSVDIVPLPVKDLLEEAKSHTTKWIVVRKGQLQLYAGQPLDEVEMNLRSLVE